MENLYFDRKKDVEHYIDEHKVKLLGVGKEGECTLLDNGYAVKLFHYPKDLDYALRLKGIKNGSLQIVEAAAIVNDEAHATFAINAPGKDLYEHAPMNQTFEIMGEQLNVLAADLRKAGNKGIRIKDSFTGNIVYDYSKFTIIDEEWICYASGGYAYTVSNGKCEFVLWEDKEDAQKVCDVLNDQRATIQSLQKDIIEMSDNHQSYIEMESETHSKINDIFCTQRRKIFRLEKENERLREQVQILKKEVRDFLHLCDVCDIQSHLSDECEEVLNDE